ncbi:MAG: glycine cleavage T C-terminal barrel domain-containing protein, partial [Ancalomicrobiaceae bacterium]|nr:glycine cleavage T C-terminal barrel domain-containing protein [Ancalomicrobiaceae bacterium]
LTHAGEDLGLKLFGARALNSLRLDKSFGSWSREYRPIYTPWEARLDRFVNLQKRDFIGRAAAQEAHYGAPERLLTTFIVDADGADVIGDEPIWRGGMVVGWVTSGGYAHWSKKSVALGYVSVKASGGIEGSYEIEIIGERRKATVQTEPLYDPKGEKMRS